MEKKSEYERVKKWRNSKRKNCPLCGLVVIAYNSSSCKSCLYRNQTKDWSQVTKADLRGQGNANRGGRYPYIRELSRKSYISSGRELSCFVCGYNLHVDICHIKDVKSFPEDATVAEINAPDNLVALCKNHHWEFDNGHRSIFLDS